MNLSKSTWLLISLALALGGFVYFSQLEIDRKQEIQAQNKRLFNFARKDIQTIIIERKNLILEFDSQSENPQKWQMKQPKRLTASNAAISFLVDLLVNTQSDRILTIPTQQSSEYGFKAPIATIKITLKNHQQHQIILGKSNWEDKLIYAQIDPAKNSPKNLSITLVPKNFQYAIEREFSEWEQ